MRKQILVAVTTAGCISRFRNGQQFTKTPKQILVNESELATLQSDSYLSVDVIPNDDVNTTGIGADDENATQNIVLDTTNLAVSPDEPSETITITPDTATDDGTIVADTAKTQTDAVVSTATDDEAKISDATISHVSQESVDGLTTIVQTMRGFNLDMTAEKPTVRELKALGLEVSAKERDEAWDVLIAEHAAK